jgi:hypothetical protein
MVILDDGTSGQRHAVTSVVHAREYAPPRAYLSCTASITTASSSPQQPVARISRNHQPTRDLPL